LQLRSHELNQFDVGIYVAFAGQAVEVGGQFGCIGPGQGGGNGFAGGGGGFIGGAGGVAGAVSGCSFFEYYSYKCLPNIAYPPLQIIVVCNENIGR